MTMRPIDAEALKTKIQKIKAEALEHGFAPESVCGDILLNFLDNAPTIEAKPVVHAHWENEHLNRYGHLCHCCSNCGFSASHKDKNWCANCGAQMDELVSNTDKLNSSVKIPVISMEDVPKIMEEKE